MLRSWEINFWPQFLPMQTGIMAVSTSGLLRDSDRLHSFYVARAWPIGDPQEELAILNITVIGF